MPAQQQNPWQAEYDAAVAQQNPWQAEYDAALDQDATDAADPTAVDLERLYRGFKERWPEKAPGPRGLTKRHEEMAQMEKLARSQSERPLGKLTGALTDIGAQTAATALGIPGGGEVLTRAAFGDREAAIAHYGAAQIGLGASIASLGARLVGRGERADLINRFSQAYQQVAAEQDRKGWIPPVLKRGARGVYRTVPTMVVAGRVAGPYGAIGMAGLTEANQAITEAKDAGLTGSDVTKYAVLRGAIEMGIAGTFQQFGFGGAESLAAGKQFASASTRAFLKEFGLKVLAPELVEENLTEIGQSITAKMMEVDPEALSTPGRIFQTLADTTVQTLMTMGIMGGPSVAQQLGTARKVSQAIEAKRSRLAELKKVREPKPGISEPFISEEDGREHKVPGDTRAQRWANSEAEIQQLERETQDAVQEREAEAVPAREAPGDRQAVGPEVRPEGGEAQAEEVQVTPAAPAEPAVEGPGEVAATEGRVEEAAPESPWAAETRQRLATVPPFEGSQIDLDESAGTAKVTRPDGRATTVHFNEDAELDRLAKKRGRKKAKGAYVYKRGKIGRLLEGDIYIRSDAGHETLNHEAIHWLEDEGVITPEEVAKLGGREAAAKGYAEWVTAKQRKPNTVFQRIHDFLEPIFSSRARLFGEIGKRGTEAPATEAQKPSAAPEAAPAPGATETLRGEALREALASKQFFGTLDRLKRGLIDEEQAAGELAGTRKPDVKDVGGPPNPADAAARMKGQGIGRQESWSRWVQQTQLRPGMDAKEWYAVYDSVAPATPDAQATPAPTVTPAAPESAPLAPDTDWNAVKVEARKLGVPIKGSKAKLVADINAKRAEAAQPVSPAAKKKQGVSIELAYERGMSVREIASTFDMDYSAVTDRLEKAGLIKIERPEASTEQPKVPPVSPAAPEAQAEATQGPEYGIKHDAMDVLRQQLGMAEREEVEPYTDEQALDDALTQTPAEVQAAIDRIGAGEGRGKLDNAMMLRRTVELGNALAAANARGDTAAAQKIGAELAGVVRADTAGGMKAGRELQSRKMVADSDMSLVGLTVRAIKAQAGMPLSEAVAKQVEKLAGRNAELKEQLAAAQAHEAETRVALEEARQQKGAKKRTGRKPAEWTVAARQKLDTAWREFRKAQSDWARGASPTTGGLPVEVISKLANVARAYAEVGVARFSEWLAAARADGAGKEIDENPEAFRAAWNQVRGEAPPPVRDPGDRAELGRYARKIHREFVEAGIPDRESRVDAVWEELQQIDPEITRRDTMDAMSGYGDFQELSKDEVSVEVRKDRGELQQLGKLEDMREGQAPKKTGIERRTPSEEERRLQKQVNEAKKRGGYVTTDPARQLQTSFRTTETTLRNRIADLQEALRTRTAIPDGTTPQYTPEQQAHLEAIRKELAELNAAYRGLFPTKAQRARMEREADKAAMEAWEGEGGAADVKTEQQRILAAAKVLDRMAKRLQAEVGQLKKEGWKKKPAAEKLTSPMLKAKQAQIEAIQAQKAELLALDPTKQADLEARSDAAYTRALKTRLAKNLERLAEMERTRELPPKKPVRKLSPEQLKTKTELTDVAADAQALMDHIRWKQLNVMEKSLRMPGIVFQGIKEIWSSIDVSFLGRQGLSLGLGRPAEAATAQVRSLGAFASEQAAVQIQEDIRNDPLMRDGTFGRMKLDLPELDAPAANREELYAVHWPQRIPIAGGWIRASGRAFVAQGNQQRIAVAKAMLASLVRGDPANATNYELEIIGHFINAASWRGDVGRFTQATVALNNFFWTPKGYVGQFQYLFGTALWAKHAGKGTWRVRKVIAQEYGRQLVGRALFYALAASFLHATLGPPSDDEDEGWSLGLFNPWHPDYGKLRIKRRRIDIMGGLAQSTRVTVRLGTNAVNGIMQLLGWEPSEEAEKEMKATGTIVARFLGSKIAPAPGLMRELAAGETYDREPLTPGRLLYGTITPLSLRDVYESMTADLGVPGGVALSMAAMFGFGGMTYKDKYRTTLKADYKRANPEKRKEIFEKDLDRMAWQSPDKPDYSELLTDKQNERWTLTLNEKKGGVLYRGLEATPERPKRDKKWDDYTYERKLKSHEESLETRKKAQDKMQEMLQSLGASHEKAQAWLLAYWRRDGETEFVDNKSWGKYDPGFQTRGTKLMKVLFADDPEFVAWKKEWRRKHPDEKLTLSQWWRARKAK